MATIKDAIKERLLDEIEIEKQRLEFRVLTNDNGHKPNFDQIAERNFLESLEKLVRSI